MIIPLFETTNLILSITRLGELHAVVQHRHIPAHGQRCWRRCARGQRRHAALEHVAPAPVCGGSRGGSRGGSQLVK